MPAGSDNPVSEKHCSNI